MGGGRVGGDTHTAASLLVAAYPPKKNVGIAISHRFPKLETRMDRLLLNSLFIWPATVILELQTGCVFWFRAVQVRIVRTGLVWIRLVQTSAVPASSNWIRLDQTDSSQSD